MTWACTRLHADSRSCGRFLLLYMFNMLHMLNAILGLILDTPLNCVKGLVAVWHDALGAVRFKHAPAVAFIGCGLSSLDEEVLRLANTDNVFGSDSGIIAGQASAGEARKSRTSKEDGVFGRDRRFADVVRRKVCAWDSCQATRLVL